MVTEINAATAMWPEVGTKRGPSQGSLDLGQGYMLLGPKDTKPTPSLLPNEPHSSTFIPTTRIPKTSKEDLFTDGGDRKSPQNKLYDLAGRR